MDGPRFIKKIHAQGILSFGPTAKEIELQPLNVVIGPNGVGKSNLIDLVSIVRALPTDVAQPFRMGGGIRNWIWSDPHQETAQLSSEIVSKSDVLRGFEHCLRFDSIEDRLNLIEEIIQTEETKLESWDQPWLRISIKDRVAKLEVRDQSGTVGMDYTKSELDPNATILAQQNAIIRLAFKNSNEPLFAVVGSVLGDLADGFKSIRIFRDWGFGTLAAARRPQGADLPADFLSEDSENLALVLNDLWLDASVQERILDLIRGIQSTDCRSGIPCCGRHDTAGRH
jgi:predicted ATPase